MGWGADCPATLTPLSAYYGYFDGNACTAGPLNFYNFGFMPLAVGANPLGQITANDILVRPSAFGVGLDFVGARADVFNRSIAYPERYYLTYSVDPPPIVAGDELRLDPPIGPITVSRWTCADQNGFFNGSTVASLVAGKEPLQFTASTFECNSVAKPTPYFIQADGIPETLPKVDASVTFDNLAAFVVVRMIIDLRPGDPIREFGGLVSLSNVVPEPGAFLPLAAGVFGLAVYVRRRRKMVNS